MAHKNLDTEEMLDVSGTWANPASEARAAILAHDDLKSFAPRIDKVHGALAAAAQPAKQPRVAEIIALQAKLDLRHDAIIRGIWHFNSALAELIGGGAGTALITLRDILLPDGLQSQLKTYRGESGQAKQLEDRMKPALRAQTDAILVGQGQDAKPLTAYVDELIDLGKQLGALEDEKAKIEAGAVDGGAEYNARLGWIRVVNAFVSSAEMAELDAKTDVLIFEPLRAAEKKADERARQAAAAKAKAAKGGGGGQGGQGETG